MTREEAIDILQHEIDADIFVSTEYRKTIHEALNMGIKALEQEPIILKANEKQLEELKELIHDNPSCVVMAEPRTGRWITQWNVVHQKEYYYCSECREEFSYDGETGIKMNDYMFCPNCGAKMGVEHETD